MIEAINIEPLEGNEIAPPLKLGKKYEVKEEYTCQCGLQHYDVGLKSKYNFITCYSCKRELPRRSSIHWCHPTRFKQV